MRPRAATIVAWEKWPDGWRIFAEVICCLGMRLLLHGETGRQSAGRLVCFISLCAPALILLAAEQIYR
jgi:hypothetical protein